MADLNSPSINTVKILLVEDSDDDAQILKRHLKRESFDSVVECIDTLEEFQIALKDNHWDIIISDYTFRGFIALDILRMIQENGLDTPCIIVSGTITDETAIDAVRAGAVDYVLKNNLNRLGTVIRRTLDEAKQKQELKHAQNKLNQYYAELERQVHKRTAELTLSNQQLTEEIAERKQAEEALKKSEEKYSSLFSNMTEAFILGEPLFDESGKITDLRFMEANKAFEKLSKMPLDTLIDRNFFSILPESAEAHNRAQKMLSKIDSTGKPTIIEDFDPVLDRWLRFYFYCPAKDRIAIILSDITDRKKAEENLAQTLQRLQAHMENSPMAIIEFDPRFRIIRWSKEAEHMFGWTAEETLGRSISEMKWVYQKDIPKVEQTSTGFSTGTVSRGMNVNRNYRKDGSVIWCEWYNSSIYDSGGKLSSVLSRVLDITERKHTEEALNKSKVELESRVTERTQQLAESEEKYRVLVENANEAVIVFQDEREKFFNHKAIELSGYSAKELATTPISEFIYPDDRKMVMEKYMRRLDAKGAPSNYEFRMIKKNGRPMWVELRPVLIKWEGRPAVLGLMTDISERKNMEQILKTYAQRITQVQEEERKRIAYELHDDTAQYLGILKMQLSSLIQSGEIKSSKTLEKLQYLERDAERAFSDVRRFSHELRPTTIEHQGLVIALEQITDDYNKMGQLLVEIRTEGMEPKLSEEVKLGFFRIAQEALNNSRKHAKASQANIDLRFGPKKMWLMVSDNGVGFDTQQELNKSEGKGGLGLLSMRERAELIGASLNIDSKPGKGTRVIAEVKI